MLSFMLLVSSTMATDPMSFVHFKTDENGQCWTLHEEGTNMLSLTKDFKQQKYVAKCGPTMST